MKLNKTLLSLTAATGIIATGAAANGAKADKITVKSGDTVSQLALDHATTVDNVQQLNNLENVDLIFVGQTLEMGDGSYTTTTYQTASQYQQNYAQNTDAQANYTQTDYSTAQNNVPAATDQVQDTTTTVDQTATPEDTTTQDAQTNVASDTTTSEAQVDATNTDQAATTTNDAVSTNTTDQTAAPVETETTTTQAQAEVQAPATTTYVENTPAEAPTTTWTDTTSSVNNTVANTNSSYSSASTTPAATTTATQNTTTSSTSSDEDAAREWIANKESGGSYTAKNGIYYGKYQLTATYLNGDYSAENQEKVANEYVASRYGSWTAAKAHWEANNWY